MEIQSWVLLGGFCCEWKTVNKKNQQWTERKMHGSNLWATLGLPCSWSFLERKGMWFSLTTKSQTKFFVDMSPNHPIIQSIPMFINIHHFIDADGGSVTRMFIFTLTLEAASVCLHDFPNRFPAKAKSTGCRQGCPSQARVRGFKHCSSPLECGLGTLTGAWVGHRDLTPRAFQEAHLGSTREIKYALKNRMLLPHFCLAFALFKWKYYLIVCLWLPVFAERKVLAV